MNEAKLEKIKELSVIAFEKRERYRLLGMMNTPQGYEESKMAAIEYDAARAEMIFADNELNKEMK